MPRGDQAALIVKVDLELRKITTIDIVRALKQMSAMAESRELIIGLVTFSVLNIWTILSFGWDKRCAMQGLRRIPERHLLTLALFGGSPGAMLARHMFRHKTRKEPFSTYLWLILVVQVGAIIGWFLL